MRFALFYHSVVSDWNHGNAHFLRGYARALQARGHTVRIFEPRDGWSVRNLRRRHGEEAVREFARVFPDLCAVPYDADRLDVCAAVRDADVVIVHEWNPPALVARVGRAVRDAGGEEALLFFHDTHHRAVTAPEQMADYDLTRYDGVLAFGEVIRRTYLRRGWARRAWTWHEGADTALFRPWYGRVPPEGDLVWIGNWGDDERARELEEFLVEPVRALRLRATVHGVRWPAAARAALRHAGIRYRGWLPNHRVPEVFARHRLTVHVPRRPYAAALPGIPTIRPFEALACGVPLVSAPWDDAERLFTPGADYLVARDGAQMTRLLASLLDEPARARALAAHGAATVLARHTCAHRADELLALCAALAAERRPPHAAAGGGGS